jgi:hypothetical protein
MPWNKEKDLKLKYEFIPDDAANAPAKKVSKSKTKSDHKHIYEPIAIDYFSRYTGAWYSALKSYCPICNKLNDFDKVDSSIKAELSSTFPGASSLGLLACYSEMEKEKYYNYIHSKYNFVVWKDYMDGKEKNYIPQDLL